MKEGRGYVFKNLVMARNTKAVEGFFFNRFSLFSRGSRLARDGFIHNDRERELPIKRSNFFIDITELT